MLRAEGARTDRIDVVAIVTPNHLHHAAAKKFLEAGFHVICDKPLTTTVADAADLVSIAERARRVLAVTYNYSGYPLVRQAREMIAAGELGELRVVQVEYAQDWLTTPLEAEGQKQASWRTDPQQAGVAGAVGDIGTHAFHLAEFVTGLRVSQLAADLSTQVAGRKLDDNAQMLLRFANGARGGLWVSQVAAGNENGLRLRIYGAERRARMVAGRAESPAARAVRRAASRDRTRRSGRDAARRQRCAHSVRTSGRLSRSVRAGVPRHRGSHRGV